MGPVLKQHCTSTARQYMCMVLAMACGTAHWFNLVSANCYTQMDERGLLVDAIKQLDELFLLVVVGEFNSGALVSGPATSRHCWPYCPI
jgi:hypothetical protein